MITHVRIQNLRSLVDTGFIELKPLTILLGSNSSGKSTFLRSFPLFTQSVNKPLREPISWFDDSLVDFGDFETAKSKFAKNGEGIIFSYKVSSPIIADGSITFIRREYYRIADSLNYSKLLVDSIVSLSFSKDSKGTFVNSVCIEKDNLNILFKIKDRSAYVEMFINGNPILAGKKWKWYYSSKLAFMPAFEDLRNPDNVFDSNSVEVQIEDISYNSICKYCSNHFRNINKLKPYVEGWLPNKEDYLDFFQNEHNIASLFKKSSKWTIDTLEFNEIYNNLALMYAIRSFKLLDVEIKKMYSGCSYIAPMRAAADRYYRTQGLQVRDVDPYGKNLQEFISSLSGNREKSYRKFTQNVLGLEVIVKNSAGHNQIVLRNDHGEYNMTDVGFGYSQILPIITKFWHSIVQFEDDRESRYFLEPYYAYMLIEQPELHLHPAMQAKTADIMMLVIQEFKKVIQENESNTKRNNFFGNITLINASMIVETHSQAMINRIGRRIRDKQFSADDVSVLLFEKDESSGKTTIKQIGYNENGQLKNWPYGFFEPSEDEYDTLFDKQSKDK